MSEEKPGEKYVGVKFRTQFSSKSPPDNYLIRDLLLWCRRFHEIGFAPADLAKNEIAGNMSIRTLDGCIITPTGIPFDKLKREDFVEVTGFEIGKKENVVLARGLREPSSEAIMHSIIYLERPHINAVFHGHSELILKVAGQMGIPVTEKKQPYGTPDLAREVMKILDLGNFLIMRDHGFLCYGGSPAEAGAMALKVYEKALKVKTDG